MSEDKKKQMKEVNVVVVTSYKVKVDYDKKDVVNYVKKELKDSPYDVKCLLENGENDFVREVSIKERVSVLETKEHFKIACTCGNIISNCIYCADCN